MSSAEPVFGHVRIVARDWKRLSRFYPEDNVIQLQSWSS